MARSFLLAGERAYEKRQLTSTTFQWLVVPAVTHFALATELYEKAILTHEQQRVADRVHRLDVLFDGLSPSSREAIAGKMALTEEHLRPLIDQVANAFVDWRYVYEHETISIEGGFVRKLAWATSDVAHMLLDPP